MKEITKYECEFCGAVFDDEIECTMHELLEHRMKDCTNEIHCWNYQGYPLNFVECVKLNMLTDDIAYIKCDSIQAAQAVNQACDITGEYSPYDRDSCPEGQELDLWHWPSESIKEHPIDGLNLLSWIDLTYIKNEIIHREEVLSKNDTTTGLMTPIE